MELKAPEPTTAGNDLPAFATRNEVAAYLRCSGRHVRNLGIPFHRLGRSVRYKREHVLAALGEPVAIKGSA